jgi:hypothetical protein
MRGKEAFSTYFSSDITQPFGTAPLVAHWVHFVWAYIEGLRLFRDIIPTAKDTSRRIM